MHNNDVLRSLRFALNLDDSAVARLAGLGGVALTEEEAWARTGREGEFGAVACQDEALGAFLDGLVLERRGPPDPTRQTPPPAPLSNNEILKKLRIALELRTEDMLTIAEAGGQKLSSTELSALLRKPGHKHYRECGNQLLRRFLRGLTLRLRPVVAG